MRRAVRIILAALVCLASGVVAVAQETRFYEENGVTYRETKQKVQRPIAETRWDNQQRTVYREKVTCNCADVQRSYYLQVNDAQWEPYIANRWNPFAQPYVAQRLVPRSRWELRTDTVRVPNPRRELVPEVVTVRVPTATTRVVEEEYISRVAVSTRPVGAGATAVAATPNNGQPTLATRPASPGMATAMGSAIGGVARLDSDPPRASSSDAWRPASPVRR